jgi:hypothetical protein|tara:strand:- start:1035 stop:1217 length:183 start_codon:yes stop_codon:yes gene_type:complete
MMFDILKASDHDLKLMRKQMIWLLEGAQTQVRKNQINRLLRRIGKELNKRFDTHKYDWTQ